MKAHVESVQHVMRQSRRGDILITPNNGIIIISENIMNHTISGYNLNPLKGRFWTNTLSPSLYTEPPELIPTVPLVRKALLAYVRIREKIDNHVSVSYSGRQITFKMGKEGSEIGFYWRAPLPFRDLAKTFSFV